jgi:hypothetical protein
MVCDPTRDRRRGIREMRSMLLKFYSLITNYRFHRILRSGLELPKYYAALKVEEIRAKAAASLTAVSAFLAFSVAVVPLVAWKESDTLFTLSSEESLHSTIFWTVTAFLLPYLGFWFERYISAASVEDGGAVERKQKRFRRTLLLILSLALSLLLLLLGPLCSPLREVLKHAFLLAGEVMILLSVVFFLFALEFYDSASGWRGNIGFHFHLAGIASNSFSFGVSLALMGSALAVCAMSFVIGRLLAAATLVVLVTMTEIERALWDLDKEEMVTDHDS